MVREKPVSQFTDLTYKKKNVSSKVKSYKCGRRNKNISVEKKELMLLEAQGLTLSFFFFFATNVVILMGISPKQKANGPALSLRT